MVLAVLIAICAIVVIVCAVVTAHFVRAADALSDRLADEALAPAPSVKELRGEISDSGPVPHLIRALEVALADPRPALTCWDDPLEPLCYCGDCGRDPATGRLPLAGRPAPVRDEHGPIAYSLWNAARDTAPGSVGDEELSGLLGEAIERVTSCPRDAAWDTHVYGRDATDIQARRILGYIDVHAADFGDIPF